MVETKNISTAEPDWCPSIELKKIFWNLSNYDGVEGWEGVRHRQPERNTLDIFWNVTLQKNVEDQIEVVDCFGTGEYKKPRLPRMRLSLPSRLKVLTHGRIYF